MRRAKTLAAHLLGDEDQGDDGFHGSRPSSLSTKSISAVKRLTMVKSRRAREPSPAR